MTRRLTYGSVIIGQQTTQYRYVEGHPPLYISYISQEQINQHQHRVTLEAAGETTNESNR